MKKKIVFLLLTLLILMPIVFIGCKNENESELTKYYLNMTFDDENYILKGSEEVVYYNDSDNMFTKLYFHLYPNAYRENSKFPIVSSVNKDKAFPNGESFGNIVIEKVYDDKNDLTFLVTGEDENILEVSLPKDVYPDEKVVIKIDFSLKLANINHRLGYGDNTINFGNFYPIVCVYENGKGFSQDLYHFNGDPFYSDCANYEFNLTYPNDYIFASTGSEVKRENNDNLTKICVKSEKTRDFAFILSKNLEKRQKTIDDITINYYGYKGDENLEDCLNICGESVKTFNKLFGKYPYKELNIVKSNFIHGGMEYPQIVFISDMVTEQKDYNYVIVHEIAHQWWYGVVGNDEYNHAWQDEGLAEFSTLLFYKENPYYGEDFQLLINNATQSYKLFEKVYTQITGNVDGRMDRSLKEFNTEPEYVQCTYTKGVLMFNSIMETVGEKKFYKALKNYYDEYAFKNAKPEDLISTFERSTGYKLEGFINSWLNGKVVIK